jgi:frataxin-like iron-binding protein CyaY
MQQLTRPAIHTALYICLILAVLGGIFRFHQLSAAPYWMDEGFTINATLAIQEKGTQILDSGFSYTCPLYCFPAAWFASFFGNSPFSYRLLAAIAGTLYIPAFFLILRRLFTLRITVLATFFVTFSYFQIAWSRQARWYTLFELFFWLSIGAFYKAYYDEKRRKLWIGLTILFTAIATQSHELGYLLPLIFAGWIVLDKVIQKRIPLKIFIPAASLGAIVLFFVAKKLGAEVNYLFPLYLNFYFKSYWIFFLLSIIAFFHPFNIWKKETYFLLFVLLSYLIPLSFLTDIINYRYLFHLTPILLVFGSIGAFAILSDLKQRWMKALVMGIIVITFFVSGVGAWKPQTMYFLEADGRHFFVPQPDWNAAYAFIKQNKKGGEVVITSQPPFNKIFLDEPGYWIRYSYNGKTYMKEKNDKEFYVGSKIINDVEELRGVTSTTHGYITLDFYAKGRISKEIIQYIETNFTEVFQKTTNDYSKVSVYHF